MNIKPTLLLDVMERGRFVCQVPYFGHGFPVIFDNGEVGIGYDKNDLYRAVLQKRPSLSTHNISIEIATQRV